MYLGSAVGTLGPGVEYFRDWQYEHRTTSFTGVFFVGFEYILRFVLVILLLA